MKFKAAIGVRAGAPPTAVVLTTDVTLPNKVKVTGIREANKRRACVGTGVPMSTKQNGSTTCKVVLNWLAMTVQRSVRIKVFKSAGTTVPVN